MELKMHNLSIYVAFLLLFNTACGFFDVEELKSFNYGIDIRNEPVVMKAEGDEVDTSTVQLTSKYGQPYQCSFPNALEQEKQKEEAEKVAMETGIPDLGDEVDTSTVQLTSKYGQPYQCSFPNALEQEKQKEEAEKGDEVDTSTVQLTSKYGQPYQCSFPNALEQEKQKEEAEKVAMETGIPDLLKPMESGPCLRKTKDWWSYEFCYGTNVKQFHLGDEGTIEGEVIILGLYESEDDWEGTEEQMEKERQEHRLRRYHTQKYVNGSKCDLNGKQRKTEVRFQCEEGSADYISRLDEPETCSYIMTVHTMKICHHPFLKPPTPTRTVAITCNPLLTVGQYQEYMQELEAKEREKKMKEEEKKKKQEEELRRLEEEKAKYYRENQLRKEAEEEEGAVEVEGEDIEDISTATDKPSSTWSEMLKNAKTADGSPLKMKTVVKYVDNPADVNEFLHEAMEEMLKLKTDPDTDIEADTDIDISDGQEGGSDLTAEQRIAADLEKMKPQYMTPEELERLSKREHQRRQQGFDSEEEEGEETDPDMEELDSELKTLKERYKDRRDKLTAIKQKVRSSMEEQYAAIIKEAEEEVEDGAGALDHNEAVKQLTQTIDDLLKKLDKTEKDIQEVDKELEQFAEYDPEGKTSMTPPVKKDELPPAEGPSKMDLEDRVKVRVSRMKPGGLNSKDGGAGSSLTSDVSDKQTEALEKNVAKELEKHGVDGGKGKIQVKINTTGYYDKDDETLHVLTEEESETFTNMIVTLIGGSVDADKEENKHSQMEENYSYVWGQDKHSGETSHTQAGAEPSHAYSDTQTDTQTDTQIEKEEDTGS